MMEERLYDLSLIEEMAGGDQDFMKELAETFVSSVPPVVEAMVEAYRAKRWHDMGQEAHSLKSNIETLQIKSISAEIRAIESNGKHAIHLDELAPLIAKVETVLLAAMDQIKQQFLL